MSRSLFILAVLSAWLVPLPVAAGSSSSSYEGLTMGVQGFEWREYTGDGTELLSERGPRLTLGMRESNLDRIYPGIIYEAEALAWLGRVAYDGHTYNAGTGALVPISTVTDYAGSSISVIIGQRYGYINRLHILDLLGGVAVDGWLRNLHGAYNDLGQFAAGYQEIYRIFSVKAVAALWQPRRGHFQVGIKYPFNTAELVSDPRVVLSPGRFPSIFSRMEVRDILPQLRGRASLVFYYDSFRFTASAVRNNVQQPQSHMDVIGVSLVFE